MTSQNRRSIMNAKQAKYPRLRFKGFTDPWEEHKFENNIVSIQTGTNLLGTDANEGTPLLKMGNIQRGYFSFNKLEYLDSNSNVESENIVNYGDFLFNTRNTLELVGKGATWTGMSGKYAFNSNIARFKFNGIDTIFFNYLYNTQQVISQVHARAVGTTSVAAVYPRDLNSLLYYLPSIEEQKKIGSFFNQLDNTIALHQRKLAKLKKLKQGYLQKLFPKNGSKFPQLRFAGFADAWEQRKLGEISKTTIGEFVIKNKQASDAPYPVYNGGTSYTGFYDEFNNEGNKIVISARGANAGFVNYIDSRFWAGNSCYSVDILDKKKFSVEFMYQLLKRNQYLFTDYQQAANIPSVSKKDVATFIVKFPTPNEQWKIGSFFKQLDHLITLHQRKLEKLQELKKGYLQKMFC
ncbi:restriction endonuclease subunit S (plasmid) [Lactiplantibacillus plantarum]|nr:restriction endonuclease subunit S [Lactiplantibacillus plantarum]AYG36293.1 restriction endonuclease subunit S [Lactiplantibacillus plantarum]